MFNLKTLASIQRNPTAHASLHAAIGLSSCLHQTAGDCRRETQCKSVGWPESQHHLAKYLRRYVYCPQWWSWIQFRSMFRYTASILSFQEQYYSPCWLIAFLCTTVYHQIELLLGTHSMRVAATRRPLRPQEFSNQHTTLKLHFPDVSQSARNMCLVACMNFELELV